MKVDNGWRSGQTQALSSRRWRIFVRTKGRAAQRIKYDLKLVSVRPNQSSPNSLVDGN
jgi:hypothetical protein